MDTCTVLAEVKDERLAWHRPELLKLIVHLDTRQPEKGGS